MYRYILIAWSLLSPGFSHGQLLPEEEPFPVYTGDSLRNLFYPLGGIGTGNILVGGRGNFLELEFFNRPQRDELPPYMTFFSLWFREEGEESGARILERRHLDDFPNPFGVPRQQLSGLPRFPEARWTGIPPQVEISLEDPEVPLDIRMECFNPLIPLDVISSSLPLGEFNWIVSNPGNKPVEFSIALQMANPMKDLNHRQGKPAHPVRNSEVKEMEYTGIFMENLIDPHHPDFGNVLMAAGDPEAAVHTGWIGERWWDDAHLLWSDFREDGMLETRSAPTTREGEEEVVGSLVVRGRIGPGDTDTVRFHITWFVPRRRLENSQAFGVEELMGHVERNFYAQNFRDAREVLEYYLSRRERLRRLSLRFRDNLAGSTVPVPVRDAAGSNLAILKSNLITRMENGDLHAYEGLGNDFGCCPGNCTHVWNYAQTMASLFPSLERNVRETAFLTQTFGSGYQCFRTTFPICGHHFRSVAADGQMGTIMRVYREWKWSGDSQWLERLWPSVKRALKYAWKGPQEGSREYEWATGKDTWDPRRRGVLEGEQHNTYDVNFYGPNMLTGSLYLGALKGCSEMARYLGDPDSSLFREVCHRGRIRYDSLLWNGSWYVQHTEEGHDAYQYGNGCLSDQLLGQYLAFNSGMGYLLDSSRVRRCLHSIYTHNYHPDLSGYENVQRVYAVNGEGGVVLCSWPGGDRERIPFPYADEVWTGVEYQVAASLIRAGWTREGLDIVESLRDRYAGYNRNPYSEIESGNYYARALAGWSVFTALGGYLYDGVEQTMTFNPRSTVPEFTTLWTSGSGWGIYRRDHHLIRLRVDFGEQALKSLRPGWEEGRLPVRVVLDGKAIPFDLDIPGQRIHFHQPVRVKSHQVLEIFLN